MKTTLIIITLLLTTGCASAVNRHQIAQTNIQKPINCDTASEDIALLTKEKATTQERLTNGLASVLPTSVMFNLLIGEFSSRKSIATGKFNTMLYMKIDEIKETCEKMLLARSNNLTTSAENTKIQL